MAPFLQYTPHARQALYNAERFADELGQRVIRPEHVLWGLLRVPEAQAVSVLSALGADVSLVCQRLESALRLHPSDPGRRERHALAPDTQTMFAEAYAESGESTDVLDTSLILLGLLRLPNWWMNAVLAQQNVTLDQARGWLRVHAPAAIPIDAAGRPAAAGDQAGVPQAAAAQVRVSPIFIGIVLVTLLAGALTYAQAYDSSVMVFLFVTGGWIISLCLHEFGHALVAYLGGDHSVVRHGYLTLNPLKYTNSVYSIVLPIIVLVLGGIGLPGGAVYINRAAIKSRGMQSLMAAAGPIASSVCALLLALPFTFGLVDGQHEAFWSGVAFLAFIQLMSVFFNLLPIPPLDGFGVLEPFLPSGLSGLVQLARQYALFVILVLFLRPSFISQGFFQAVAWTAALLRINPHLVVLGNSLFRFWTGS